MKIKKDPSVIKLKRGLQRLVKCSKNIRSIEWEAKDVTVKINKKRLEKVSI